MKLALPIQTVESVTRSHAAAALGVGIRQLRALVRAGRLVMVGIGHGRRVTTTSLAGELSRRQRKAEVFQTESGNAGETRGNFKTGLPDFSCRGIDTDRDVPHTRDVVIRFPREIKLQGATELELLSLSSAAAAVNISDPVFRKLVEAGVVPSVTVGTRRRVSRAVLEAWVRGQGTPGSAA